MALWKFNESESWGAEECRLTVRALSFFSMWKKAISYARFSNHIPAIGK